MNYFSCLLNNLCLGKRIILRNDLILSKLLFNIVFYLTIGPRPDLDPDIIAALDDDFDFDSPDNLLEDDFILRANKPESLELEKELSW